VQTPARKRPKETLSEGESTCIQQLEKTREEEEKEKAVILSWREDPGLMWLSENSELDYVITFLLVLKVLRQKKLEGIHSRYQRDATRLAGSGEIGRPRCRPSHT
jgi:hypothetical protein